MNKDMYSMEQVIAANVEIHTAAKNVYGNEPHYSPENKTRVREIIKYLKSETDGNHFLDVGCGMGFIIDIAKEFFKVIRGVDVTPAMLEQVNLNGGESDIEIALAKAESLPYPNNTFDVCSAHALLHHLHDVRPVLKEIYRVLKPGGLFYADLDPNAYYWKALKAVNPEDTINEVILKEIAAINNKDQEIAEQLHLDAELIKKAEYLKHVKGGFQEEELYQYLTAAKFFQIHFQYQWFLGEAKVIRDPSRSSSAPFLRTYLQEVLPLTRHLFKYISFIAKVDKKVM